MRLLLYCIVSLATPLLLHAQDAEAPSSGGTSLWGLLQQGGWAMWPLGACSLATIFLAIHAARETRRARFLSDDLTAPLGDSLASRDLPRALDLVSRDRTVLARVLRDALTRARADHPDANRTPVEQSIAEGIEHEEAGIGQWVNYLNVVATVSPMIGLLGTVSGMIGAFQTMSLQGMGKPQALAGDIGEALITTATGLVIGIPAMVAYFVLRNRLGNQVAATTKTATRLIDRLAETDETEPRP